jgi:L-lactate dehydrogenase complex protein LldE
MASRKTADILAARPQMLVSGDLGCLLQLAGRLREEGSDLEVRHVAEVLAGRLEACPGIGSPRRDPH